MSNETTSRQAPAEEFYGLRASDAAAMLTQNLPGRPLGRARDRSGEWARLRAAQHVRAIVGPVPMPEAK